MPLPCGRYTGGCFSNFFFFAPPLTNAEMVAPPAGSWEVSMITEEHSDYLRRMHRIRLEERVEACVPGPHPSERMVFGTHFNVDFGLLVSLFMRLFLEFFGLEMHHLGPKSVLYLACFTMLCEGYLVFWPFSSLFRSFFHSPE
ncbi:hypothetical protein D1007_00244 [Hordeum vulgare]|nr:hypothetical protein D1007_00244 [Hordeum vulgare]